MDDVTPFARRLRVLWAAICASAALIVLVMGSVAASSEAPPLADRAEAAFYLVALVGIAGLGAGLYLIRSMETQLAHAGSDAEARQTLQTMGILALAVVESTAVLAGAAAVVTGDLLVLAFAAPLFAFAWLTWPSDGRVMHWLSLRTR